jgi:hypothetical protein
MTALGIEPATFRIVDDITTVENIINSFMTLSDFKLRAKKFSLMMVKVTEKHVAEML